MSDDDVDDDVEEGGEEAELDDGDEEGGDGKRLSGRKLILFVGAPLILLIGAAATAYFTGAFESLLGGAPTEEAEVGTKSKSGEVVFFNLPEMLVNLNTGTNQANFLKVKVSLDIEDPGALEQLTALQPRVIDNFQVYLRELRLEDLNGAAGMYRLKEELLMRVNTAVHPIKVNDILFEELLVK